MFCITHKTRQSGFTLLELLVVFSLMTIITGIGFASFSSYSQHQEVNQAASDVKQAFNKARMDALSQVKPSDCSDTNALLGYKVNISAPGSYSIVAVCQLASPSPAPEDVHQLPGAVIFSGAANACSGVEFYTLSNTVSIPSGCTPFDISLNSSIKKTLTVESNGMITISP